MLRNPALDKPFLISVFIKYNIHNIYSKFQFEVSISTKIYFTSGCFLKIDVNSKQLKREFW